jgi:hypothetical protein
MGELTNPMVRINEFANSLALILMLYFNTQEFQDFLSHEHTQGYLFNPAPKYDEYQFPAPENHHYVEFDKFHENKEWYI